MKTKLKVLLLLAFGTWLSASAAFADTDWQRVDEGRLEIRNADLQAPNKDVPSVVPLKHTGVDIQVRGFVAEVTVTQQFENTLDRPIEAEYVFPLQHDAAVNSTEMRIGDRVIKGRIDRRDAARRPYEAARDAGRRASLLEQERPNIFTQSVANIGPHETIEVVIRYVETLPYKDGRYEVVFPMVVGPRYIPGSPTASEGRAPAGHGRDRDTDQVPDASRISPPALGPGERGGSDIDLAVNLDTGVPIRGVRSRAHRIEEQRAGENQAVIRLAADDRIPNKDFVLEVEVAGEQPEIGLLAHHDGKHGYFTLVLQPPKTPDADEIRPREILCVVDCSGSMDGQPLELAKRAVEKVLTALRPTDYFNIWYFSMRAEGFKPQSVPATPADVSAAVAFVRSLRSIGGTEMMTGVRAALAPPPPEGCLRIVAFFTDGYIGNEQAILGEEQRLLGDARLFSFGVGSSVNRYLLDRMAVVGRGTAQYVLLNDRPEKAIDAFSKRMDKPVLTDISVKFDGADVHSLLPAAAPDVFAGMPVYIHGRYEKPWEGTVEVLGRIGTQPRAAKLQVTLPGPSEEHSPLPSIWARQQIKDLEIEQSRAGTPLSELEQRITQLALEYSLMSAYTSFVAVDETPATEGSGRPQFVPVSVPMPEGVQYDKTINEAANFQARGGGGSGGQAGGGPSGGGSSGGGPIGPFGVLGVAVLAIAEWRRRRRNAPCA